MKGTLESGDLLLRDIEMSTGESMAVLHFRPAMDYGEEEEGKDVEILTLFVVFREILEQRMIFTGFRLISGNPPDMEKPVAGAEYLCETVTFTPGG